VKSRGAAGSVAGNDLIDGAGESGFVRRGVPQKRRLLRARRKPAASGGHQHYAKCESVCLLHINLPHVNAQANI
jgi:hypothetical protein